MKLLLFPVPDAEKSSEVPDDEPVISSDDSF